MCSGFKPKARFYWLLGLKNRHFYAVPGTAGKSSSADKPRGSAEALENSRILRATLRLLQRMISVPLAAGLVFMPETIQTIKGLFRLQHQEIGKPIRL